jgi:hypothetical protein
MNINYPQVVAMTIGEFKAFKRQVQSLVRIGYHVEQAVSIVLAAPRFQR